MALAQFAAGRGVQFEQSCPVTEKIAAL